MRLSAGLIAVICASASAPAIAEKSEEEKVEAMIEDSWFRGSASYPDELSPALTPFLHCELRRAGSQVTMNGEVQEGPDTSSECSALRETALRGVNAVLDDESITSPEARAMIIRRAFGAIEALAASQRIWREASR
jgi:hypothetical protein